MRNAQKEDFGLKSILLEELERFRGSCKPPKSQSFSPRSGKGYAEPGELEFLDGWCSEGFFFKVLVGRPPPKLSEFSCIFGAKCRKKILDPELTPPKSWPEWEVGSDPTSFLVPRKALVQLGQPRR